MRKHSIITTEQPYPMTEREYLQLGADDMGICRSCGAQQGGCEPDARDYTCEACGSPEVYGAEELLTREEIEFI